MATHAQHHRWTDTDIETIRILLTEQKANRAAIAKHFNVNIRSVARIVTRAGLAGLNVNVDPKKPVAEPPGRIIKFGPVRIGPSLRDLPIEHSSRAVGWEAFMASVHCHWPVADDPFKFCGKKKMKHSSYCKHHLSRSLNHYIED
jgi:hypothetical protein